MNNGWGEKTAVLPEFLAFRRLIAPGVIQFGFWPMVLIGIYYNTWQSYLDVYSVNWLSITSGFFILRIALEFLFMYIYLRKTS